ncbi:flavodoxin family protein [Parabacteroides sp. PF5-9]|uniref:flavodoxin family protein n=1 Tax=Parabacteroides sp. PF5-9 TaxID=1742404 RepID=UPI0024767A7B|nr:flavodoxin family protein [Parabacteroides sp. PF5-9]MDH6357545.1 multimeric flavodoxin WrbA [Parabacteroides sp. PF5-9]
MKVILINGSPHPKGCTYTALNEVASTLEKNNIETELFQLGRKPISGCLGCNSCTQTGKCIVDDLVNVFIDKAKEADGFIFGSPVHYASASGAMTSFMDRVFYAGAKNMRFKPAAAVVSCRRAGSTAALDQLNKYFMLSQMPVVSSQYWNMVHGFTPDDVRQDKEGMQTMRVLGNNMAWFLYSFEAAQKAGINRPEQEERIWTPFIR